MTTNAQPKPLRVQFIATELPVGGAETLLLNLVRRLDRARFTPEIICLKEPGPIGETLAAEMPVHSRLINHKFDFMVLPRLRKLMRDRVDAVVTVAAGDNMFWGRLAAKLSGVPVIASALHSTGWPDGVGKLNRRLTPITDAFIAVADGHAKFLHEFEGFPESKVHTIYNGVDTDCFVPANTEREQLRTELHLPPSAKLVTIVAALRPEKNHELFLRGAAEILKSEPDTHFLVVGEGPERPLLESLIAELDLSKPGISGSVHLLGSRDDVPAILAASDLLALTSHNEASPVSILEALSCGLPVVASEVGSVSETVLPEQTGLLFTADDRPGFVAAALRLLRDDQLRSGCGAEGRRRVVEQWSLNAMTAGYEDLIQGVYDSKRRPQRASSPARTSGRTTGRRATQG